MKTALVTGANRGIGLAIAAGLNKSGDVKVLVGSRRVEDGENAARTLGGNAVGVQLDLSAAKGLQHQVKTIVETHSPIDILVNNAGVLENGNLLEVDSERLNTLIGGKLPRAPSAHPRTRAWDECPTVWQDCERLVRLGILSLRDSPAPLLTRSVKPR